MYLTQVTIDGLSLQKHKLFDAYCWKRAICEAFHPIDEEKSPFLFDIRERGNNGVVVLILSERQPKVLPFGIWQTKFLSETFFNQKRYFFDVYVNPSVKKPIYDENGNRMKQGKRKYRSPSEYDSWMTNKLQAVGCKVLSISNEKQAKRVCFYKGKSTEHDVVRFRGAIEVNDIELFKKAMIEGFGPAKRFGFGLMHVNRI